LASLLISLAGLLVAGIAWYKADSVAIAVRRILGQRDNLDDLITLQDTLRKLKDAYDVARRRTIPDTRNKGVSLNDDIEILSSAHLALSTGLPSTWDGTKRRKTTGAAASLHSAISTNSKSQVDWKQAFAALNVVIPYLQQQERELRNVTLAPSS